MFDLNIETIIVIMKRWTNNNHGFPWFIFILRQYLSQRDIRPWKTLIDYD